MTNYTSLMQSDPAFPHGHHGQPGLEVVNQQGVDAVNQEGLEVRQDHFGYPLPEVRADEYSHGGKESVSVIHKYPGPQYSEYPEHYASPDYSQGQDEGPSGHTGRRKRLWLIVGGVIAAVVILGAVLGGVLGSRAAKSSSSSSSSSSGSGDGSQSTPSASNTPSSNNTTPKLQSIRQGSGLSVTGWRKPDGSVETRLFYQDPQDGLRFSRCDTSRRSPGNDSTCWDTPVSFNSFAKAGTRLAASTLLWGDNYEPQTQLFYAGFKTRLLGVHFNEQVTPPTAEDSVNQVQINTSPDSSLTAYWPWTIYQDATGVLYHVRNRLLTLFAPSTTDWDNNRLNITAQPGSRLAIAPMSANFSRIALKGGYAIFYQDIDDKLAVSVTDLTSPQLASDYPLSWEPTALPDITLPKLAPLAAFSVARKGDALQRVDTYVLYRDANADVNVVYAAASGSDSDSKAVKWKTARPAALRGVDPDSDIACLTMATSFYDATKAAVLLEEASEETRCYVQKGGRVVEVRLDAGQGEWAVVGDVPMP